MHKTALTLVGWVRFSVGSDRRF